MNKLAIPLLTLLLAAPALPAQPRSRLYTRPTIPSREVLDRLNLKIGWQASVPTDGRRDGLAFIQIGAKDLFVQMRSGIIAVLDAETGRTRWRARVGKPYEPVLPLAFNSRGVYVVSATELHALDRETGVSQWVFRVPGGATAGPVCDELNVYLETADTRLTAYLLPRGDLTEEPDIPRLERPVEVDLYKGNPKTTGAIGIGLRSVREASRREVTGPQPKRFWGEVTTHRLAYRPVQTREFLLLPTPSGEVVTYGKYPPSNADALRHFTYTMSSGASVGAGQFGDQAYVGSEDGTVYAFDIPGGRLVWRHVTGDPITRQPVALEQDVYITSQDAGLARLDRSTSAPAWRVPHRGVVLESNPEADRFLAANDKFVYALDHSGRLLVLSRRLGTTLSRYNVRDWPFPVPNEITDRLYLAANNGMILCLHDLDYRTPLRHRTLQDEVTSAVNKILAQKITRPVGNPTPLRDVLDELSKNYKLKFFISERAFKEAGRTTAFDTKAVIPPPADEEPLGDFLKKVLVQVDAGYQVVEDTILIFPVKKK
jgi:outer membrane protein assembly factor BamB